MADSGPPVVFSDQAEPCSERHGRIVLRCSPEYHAWACGLADWMGGIGLTLTLETGLRRLAESSGYPTLPPRRYRPGPRPARE